MQFFTDTSRYTRSKLYMLSLTGISKIMHCGILINTPYWISLSQATIGATIHYSGIVRYMQNRIRVWLRLLRISIQKLHCGSVESRCPIATPSDMFLNNMEQHQTTHLYTRLERNCSSSFCASAFCFSALVCFLTFGFITTGAACFTAGSSALGFSTVGGSGSGFAGSCFGFSLVLVKKNQVFVNQAYLGDIWTGLAEKSIYLYTTPDWSTSIWKQSNHWKTK